jgi:hypothetical protein
VSNVRVWTIQPAIVWERLREQGVLGVDETELPYGGHIPEAYRWLASELCRRLADYPGTLPWWAYCKKPDLRLFRHHRPPGPEVRMELEPRSHSMVTFPIWAWDAVYGGDYLSPTREEHAAWTARLAAAVPDEDTWPLPEPWSAELEASWQRLFDPALPAYPWDERRIGMSGSREAVLGLLHVEDVRRVTTFVGCGPVRY